MKYNEEPLDNELVILQKIQEFEADLEKRENSFAFDEYSQAIREEKYEEFLYWKAEQKKQIEEIFDSYIKKYEREQKYYYGCSFLVFKETYSKRKKSFLEEFQDATEVDFINEELITGAKIIPYEYLNHSTKKRIAFSLNKRFEYLTERAKENGFEIKHFPANQHPEFNYLEHHEFSLKETEKEVILEPLNLDDTKATEKIIYLYELGLLHYLKELEPFNLSTNLMATVLSAITGEKANTIQSYLNPLLNEDAIQKNNPLNSTNKVMAIKQTLTNLGFKPTK